MSNLADTSFEICIVIPCYNEEKGLDRKAYFNFINNHSNVLLCFVNDGSTDNTANILAGFQETYPENIAVINCTQNVGKAEAIRTAIAECNNNYSFTYIAYLDADLATSLEECLSLTSYFNESIHFVFGSRIMKVGSTIKRSQSRFLIGRIIATAISNILDLKVYDTQCGCKLFTKELSKVAFKNPFISKWLFDVEIFNRLMVHYGVDQATNHILEIPLKRWIDQGDSKVKLTYFFKLWVDLYKINKVCKASRK
ncbi:glycosyltransferase [Pontimicrobium sp. SW4]|uniref:Glycosyltransferase n=1 Tax=Pontimicrobium sp. SW4 TaxID=3153519 RepID=A0AAU7BV58_9FLAO